MADPKRILDYGLPSYVQSEKPSRNSNWQTLVGLGLLLMIGVVLWAAVMPVASPGRRHSRSTDVRSRLTLIATALNNFYTDMGRFPTAAEGLNILIVPPNRAPYLEDSRYLTDTWGHPFIYTPPGNGKGEIRSCGPDGIRGTADDVFIPFEPSQSNP